MRRLGSYILFSVLAGFWCLFALRPIAAQGLKTYEIGPASQSASSTTGWILSGVSIAKTASDQAELVLVPAAATGDADEELYLAFDEFPLRDSTGQWTVLAEGTVEQADAAQAKSGTGAGRFTAPRGKLVLAPERSRLFATGAAAGDFTLEFWLNPARAENGEVLFLYRSTLGLRDKRLAQQLAISISRNRLTFGFFNFFVNPSGAETIHTLQGASLMVPGRWSHHLLRFDASTGLLEYALNGSVEAVLYVTSSGREGSTVFVPLIGGSQRFELAPNFTGLFDNFRISNSFRDDADAQVYRSSGGIATSPVFDLGSGNNTLSSTRQSARIPGNSAIQYAYRLAETNRGWTDDWPEWMPLVPGQDLSAAKASGRFFQVRLELYPDQTGALSPAFSSLQLRYVPDLPPPPPAWLDATAGDGRISLEWSRVGEADVSGYLVYYGTTPGRYFGTGANEGDSPIIVRDPRAVAAVLSGLTNGTLYFVAVAAMDNANPPNIGDFSVEVSARPARTKQ